MQSHVYHWSRSCMKFEVSAVVGYYKCMCAWENMELQRSSLCLMAVGIKHWCWGSSCHCAGQTLTHQLSAVHAFIKFSWVRWWAGHKKSAVLVGQDFICGVTKWACQILNKYPSKIHFVWFYQDPSSEWIHLLQLGWEEHCFNRTLQVADCMPDAFVFKARNLLTSECCCFRWSAVITMHWDIKMKLT